MGRISRGHPSPWRPRTPQAVEVGVRACVGEDGRVSFRDLATTLAFEGSGHHGGTARGVATTDEVVDEGDQVIRQSDGDLCAHTKTIPEWDAPERGMSECPTSRRSR